MSGLVNTTYLRELADFILDRLTEVEAKAGDCHDTSYCANASDDELLCNCGVPDALMANAQAVRQVVEWHKAWPVLVEQPPTFTDQVTSVDAAVVEVTRRIAWMTEQKYREAFGSEPPTSPILRILAQPYASHEDFREEWRQ